MASSHPSSLQSLIELEGTFIVDTSVPFGKPTRDKHFRVGRHCHYYNHGSYGSTLRLIAEFQHRLAELIDENPSAFYDEALVDGVYRAAADLAQFVNCDPKSLVLVPNATTATSTVLFSLPFTAKDTIMGTGFTYGAVKNQLQFVSERHGAHVVLVDLLGALDRPEEMLRRFETAVKAHPETSLVILDHIIAATGTITPLGLLVPMFKRHGIRVLVDGAHALGQIPIDLRDLGVDFYCSNAHKWLCAAMGCAFLYVAPQHHTVVRPLVVSSGYRGGFTKEFSWTGSKCYLPYLSLPLALRFIRAYTSETIMTHNNALARKIGAKCAAAWGTSLLCDASAFAAMVSVALPQFKFSVSAASLRTHLRHQHKMEVPITAIGGRLYARISAQTYLDESDFDPLINAVLGLAQRQYL